MESEDDNLTTLEWLNALAAIDAAIILEADSATVEEMCCDLLDETGEYDEWDGAVQAAANNGVLGIATARGWLIQCAGQVFSLDAYEGDLRNLAEALDDMRDESPDDAAYRESREDRHAAALAGC